MGVISYEEAIQFARDCYLYESGTRKAVDEGLITIKELATYHFINSLANQNVPFTRDMDEQYRLYDRVLPKAFKEASEVFHISKLEAKTLFEKICAIPRVA